MKKFVVTVLSALLAANVFGQGNQKILPFREGEVVFSTPPEFSSGGISRLIIYENPEIDGIVESALGYYYVYDEDFSVERTIEVPCTSNPIYVQTIERQAVPELWYRNDNAPIPTPFEGPITIEEAKAILEGSSFNICETKEDGVYFYSSDSSVYYKYEEYGLLYPTYCYWLANGELRPCYISYKERYIGEWQEKERKEYEIWDGYAERDYTSPIALRYSRTYPGASSSISLSQTLFNDDDKYEYIVPIVGESVSWLSERDRDGDDEIDCYEKYYGYATSGFNVVSEDGTILNTVKYDGGFVLQYESGNYFIYLVEINDKFHIITEGYIIDENNFTKREAVLIYELDKQSNSIKKVATHVGMVVHPTIASETEQITVDLSDENDANEIVIVGVSGQIVKRIPIQNGQKKITFNAQGLNKGLNVVNTRGGKESLSQKFFVK